MNPLILIFTLIISSHALGSTLKVTVEAVEEGKKGDFHLLFLSDGHVAYLKNDQSKLTSSIKSFNRNRPLLIKMDHQNIVKSYLQLEEENPSPNLIPENRKEFEPTILSGPKEAKSINRRINHKYHPSSQCYNRAHIWAYEEFQHSGLNSQKIFLFFTTRYIRKHHYQWWFHVAPLLKLENDNAVVLDAVYFRKPVSVSRWTNKFISPNRNCPIVVKYSSYQHGQETEDCYLMAASMFYWQPRDLETFETEGVEKTDFFDWEIKYAYEEAFP